LPLDFNFWFARAADGAMSPLVLAARLAPKARIRADTARAETARTESGQFLTSIFQARFEPSLASASPGGRRRRVWKKAGKARPATRATLKAGFGPFCGQRSRRPFPRGADPSLFPSRGQAARFFVSPSPGVWRRS
jgi:hypothetical protein